MFDTWEVADNLKVIETVVCLYSKIKMWEDARADDIYLTCSAYVGPGIGETIKGREDQKGGPLKGVKMAIMINFKIA